MKKLGIAAIVIVALAAFTIIPVSAQGDPGAGCPSETEFHDTIHGDVYFEQQGFGYYNSMTKTFNNVPDGIKVARIYTGFWQGSPGKGGFFNITIQNATGSYTTDTYKACDPCPQATGCAPWQTARCDVLNDTINWDHNEYLDRVNMHDYDVGCGVQFVSFDATPYITPGSNTITVKKQPCSDCTRGRWDGRIYVIALLVVYENESMPEITYWINEGAPYLEEGSDCDGSDDHYYASKYFNGTHVNNPTRVRLWSLGWPHVINADTKLNDNNTGDPDIAQSYGSYEVLLRWENIPTSYLDDTSNFLEYYDLNPVYERAFAEVLIVQGPSGKPDLIVTDINAYHNNTDCPAGFNLSNEIDVTIKNNGSAVAGASNVSLYIDDEFFGRLSVPSLAAGAIETVTFKNWKPIGDDCLQPPCDFNGSYRDYNFTAVADCDNDVAESNETNNETTVVERASYNGYMADEPLENVAHDTLHGHLIFTTGDGVYSSLYNYGDTQVTNYDITIPDNATVKLANLNVYYTWCKPKTGIEVACPEMEVSIDGQVLPLEKAYNDIKCTCPGASWVYPWGNYVYNVTDYIDGSGTYTVTVKNNCTEKCKYFCPAAPGIVLVYEDENAPLIEYWVSKGADVLMGGRRYPTSSNLAWWECINNATFQASAETGEVVNATLGVVAPWGDDVPDDVLFFNDVEIGRGVYLGYNGTYDETIDSISMHIGSTNAQVGVNVTNVTALYLKGNDNVVGQADDGDNMMPSNAFLVVEYKYKMPDLVITNKSEALENGTFTVTYTVANVGDGDAGESNTTVFIDGVPKKGDPVPALAAGESCTNTVGPFDCPCGATPNITVCADNENVVEECNEENNCLSNELVCPGIPDLVVEKSVTIEDGTFLVNYNVMNIGCGPAGESTTCKFVDGELKESQTCPALGSCESYNGTFGREPCPCGATLNVTVCADNYDEVNESDETNNCEVNEVVCPGKPDLVITEKYETFVDGGNFTITYKVNNIGCADAGASHTTIYIDSVPLDVPTPAIPKGECHENTVGPFECPCGATLNVTVCADNYDEVDESDETNNCKVNEVVCPGKPDMVITEKSETFVDSGNFNITYKVNNTGCADADASRTTIYFGGVPLDVPTPAIPKGECHENTVGPFECPCGATLNVTVCADNYDEVDESDEMNNCEVNEVVCPGKPDLVITEKSETFVDSGNFNITYKVNNTGCADADASRTTIYFDDVPLDVPTPAIPKGEYHENTVGPFECPCGATLNITVCADNGNAVAESNETNNCEVNEVVCPGKPDLVITEKSETFVDSGNFNITYKVNNTGCADADASRTTIYFDGVPLDVPTPAIAKGEYHENTVGPFECPCGATLNITVCADNYDEVDESDETNNCEVNEVVCPGKPDLVITEKSETFVDSGNFTITYKVNNTGCADADASRTTIYFDGVPLDVPTSAIAKGEYHENTVGPFECPCGATLNITVCADNYDEVDESDETNNCEVNEVVCPGKPDLVITEKSETFVDSGNFTITYKVNNTGCADADASRTTIYFDGVPLDVPTPAIAKGEYHENTVGPFECPCGATLNITVCADNENVVEESNETNNCKMNEVVCPVVEKPDLLVTEDINAYHNNIGCPAWFTLSNEIDVTVKNNGSAVAGASNVSLYIDDKFFGKLPVSSLSAGASETVTFENWKPIGEDCLQPPCKFEWSYKDYNIMGIADCDNDVAESNETNNEETVVDRACYNGYMADEPLKNVAHGKLHGHLIFTTGDGRYKSLSEGNTQVTNYDVNLPEGASVELAHLNVYYTWSIPTGTCPKMKVKITTPGGTTYTVPLMKEAYNDIKCQCPGAPWVYSFGNYVYDITDCITENGTYTVTVTNAGSLYFCPAAPGIVLVYIDENAPQIEYWINEGADVLIGGRRGDGGYLAWWECINNATFPASTTTGKVVTATLGVVAPWGDEVPDDILFFNEIELGRGVYNGYHSPYSKTIDSLSMEIGGGNAQVGISVTSVTAHYLKGSDNVVGQADDGDCMMPANAFLVVEYEKVEPKPDLEIVDKWEEWVDETHYNVTYVIHNSGTTTAPASHNTTLIVDGVEIEHKHVPVDLEPCQNYTDTFDTVIECTGDFDTIKVRADNYEVVEELNETNNCRENVWPCEVVEKPDLEIEDKWEEWVNETHYNVTYVIHNNGTATAPASHHTTLIVDGVEIEHKHVPVDLEPCQNYTDTFDTVIERTDESDTIKVCADNYKVVDELDEDNNCLENVWTCLRKPDLEIVEKWEEWVNETHYNVTYVIRNTGTAVALAGHNTTLYVDGVPIEHKHVPVALEPCQNYTDTFDTVIECTGESDTIKVCADNYDVVEESNETNNCLENVWPCEVVEKPDLEIEDKWEEWVNETHYNVTYVIHNNGTATAPACHNTTLIVDGVEREHKPMPVDLEPCQNYTDTFDTVIECTDESDTIKVCADNYDVVEESNETNNCLENVWPCEVVEKPDLEIEDKWEEWVNETHYNVTYVIHNNGTATAPACHNTTLIVDGVEREHKPMPVDLDPCQNYTDTFDTLIECTGDSDTIKVCADNYDVVDELDEDNNCLENAWSCLRAMPGISVNKVANPPDAAPSSNVVFTITVPNTGDCILDPVKVVDTLPAWMSYVSSSPAADTHDGTIIWNNVGPLDPGASKTITLVARIDSEASGTLTNAVTVTATDPAGEEVTDYDTVTVTVLARTIEPPTKTLIAITTEIKSDGTVIEEEQFGWVTGNGNLLNNPPLSPGEAVGSIKYDEKMIGSNGTTEFEKCFGVNTNVTPNLAVTKDIGYKSGNRGSLSYAEQVGMRYSGASPPLSSNTKCEEVNAYSEMVVMDVQATSKTEAGITETHERDLLYETDAEGKGSVSAGVDASVEDGAFGKAPASRMSYKDKSNAYGNFSFEKRVDYKSKPSTSITTDLKSDRTVIEEEQFGWESGNGNLLHNDKMIGSNGTTEFEKRFDVNTNVTPNLEVDKRTGYKSGDLGSLSHAEQVGMRYSGTEVNAYSEMVVTDVEATTETEVGITERDLLYEIDAEGNGTVSAGVDASVGDGRTGMTYTDKSNAYGGNFSFEKKVGYKSKPP